MTYDHTRIRARPAPRRLLGTVLPASVGFLVGALFWHFIGFWGFVSSVVLNGDPGIALAGVRAMEPRQLAGSGCTTLELDRSSGRTVMRPCAPEAAASPSPYPAPRGNLAGARKSLGSLQASAEAEPLQGAD